MPNRNDCWGIEVGANAIKAIRLVRKKAEITVADYEIIPFKKILTTPDINVDEAIQVNLDQFLSQHSVTKSTVVVSVPGHMAFARFAKLPPVDPKKIPDIVRFEAVQQIPFPIDQVEWDYQVFSRADSPDVEVGIVAITKERVVQYLNNYFAVGLSVDGLTLSPMAVYNALAYDLELTPESSGIIFVDIGTIATDLIVVDNGQVWLRTLPIGGNNFTEALVRAFKLSFPKAERLKREAGTSKYARQIFQAMRPVFADLVQEMQRSLGYYQSLYRDAKLTKLVGVGSTFRLPGMQKFLKQQLQLEVERPTGFKRVNIAGKEESAFAENAMNLATAYGLALQGLELEKVSVNVLPTHLVRQRVWRDKSIWFGAAAGLMVGAVGLAGGKLWLDKAAYDSAFAAADRDIKDVQDQATRLVNEWNDATHKSDPQGQIENLRGMLDYRDVWPKLMQDLDGAIKTINPQKEMEDSNYEAIRKIKRTDRRRLYIKTYTAEYHFDKMPEPKAATVAGAGTPSATPKTAGGPAAGPGGAAAVKTADSTGAGAKPGGAVFAAWKSGEASPYFIITITGTTTYNPPDKQVIDLLSETFVKSLQDNSVRADRPYRIVVDPATAIVECIPPYNTSGLLNDDSDASASPDAPGSDASSSRTSSGSGGQGAAGSAGAAATPRPPGAPGTPGTPGANGASSKRTDVWSTHTDSSTPTGSGLLPIRPLDNEPKTRDWRFVITWKVQLVRPEAVRQIQEVTVNDALPEVTPAATPAAPSPARPPIKPVSAKSSGAIVAPANQKEGSK